MQRYDSWGTKDGTGKFIFYEDHTKAMKKERTGMIGIGFLILGIIFQTITILYIVIEH